MPETDGLDVETVKDIAALKEYLKDPSFVVLCVAIDLGRGPEPVVIVKSSRDLLDELRAAGANPELAWVTEQTEAGPVVCLVLRTQADGVGSLAGETYFDLASELDRMLLQRMTQQMGIRVVYLGEDADVVWVAQVPWGEIRQLETEQVLDRADQLLEKARSYDFTATKDLFQGAVTLDELLGRAFPGV